MFDQRTHTSSPSLLLSSPLHLFLPLSVHLRTPNRVASSQRSGRRIADREGEKARKKKEFGHSLPSRLALAFNKGRWILHHHPPPRSSRPSRPSTTPRTTPPARPQAPGSRGGRSPSRRGGKPTHCRTIAPCRWRRTTSRRRRCGQRSNTTSRSCPPRRCPPCATRWPGCCWRSGGGPRR